MLKLIYKKFKKFVHNYHINKSIKKMDNDTSVIYSRFLQKNHNNNVASDSQLKAIETELKNKFGYKFGQQYYKLIYLLTGEVNSKYISDSLFYTLILKNLNDKKYSKVLENKGLYNFYYNKINRPVELIRNINGIFYKSDNSVCNESEAISIILSYNKRILVKPSVDSERGMNVNIYESYDENKIKEIFSIYKNNFLIQNVIEASPVLKKFNETSLNTFRFTTLFLNGNVTILSACLRFGNKGSVVDNVGSGGFIIGVKPDGCLYDYCYDYKGNIYSEHNGIKFSEFKIPEFDKISNFALQCAYQIPFISMAGLDISVDKDGNPILIEVNLSSLGIFYEQMCCGPVFGERYDEVLNYLKGKI